MSAITHRVSPGTALRPVLRELLENSKLPTSTQLWKALSLEERARGLWVLLSHSDAQASFLGSVIIAVERTLHLRRQTVLKKPVLELARDAARCDPSDLPVESALREIHLGDRRPLLIAFLEALAIPNENGLVDLTNQMLPLLTVEDVSVAVDTLAGTFAPDDIAIYLLTLLVIDTKSWVSLDSWRVTGGLQLAAFPIASSFPLSGPVLYSEQESAGDGDGGEVSDNITSADGEVSSGPDMRENRLMPDRPVRNEEELAGSAQSPVAALLARLYTLHAAFESFAGDLRATANRIDDGIPPRPELAENLETISESFQHVKSEVQRILGEGVVEDSCLGDIFSLIRLVEQRMSDDEDRSVTIRRVREILRQANSIEAPEALNAALDPVRDQTGSILAALEGNIGSDLQAEIDAIGSGAHSLTALVKLVRDDGDLSVDDVNSLAAAVKTGFGEQLAVAAMRGKLRLSIFSSPQPCTLGNQ